MKIFNVETLTKEIIGKLVTRDDSKDWQDHGGKDGELLQRITRNFKMVETAYMQDQTDEERYNAIHKAFRLGMYGVLVDMWKELALMANGDFNILRKWALAYYVNAAAVGVCLNGTEPFLQFPEELKLSAQHHLSKNAQTLTKCLEALRRSFASMTRETNCLVTKERAQVEIFKLLKANPLIQETFLSEVLIESVFNKIKEGNSAVIRTSLMTNIFNLLIAGENIEPLTEKERFNFIKSEIHRTGFFIFKNEDELNAFAKWADENNVYPDNIEMVVHASEIDPTKQNIMFVPGSITIPTKTEIRVLLEEELDYSGLQALGASADILRVIDPNFKQKEEAVKQESYIQFMGTDHLVGGVERHGSEQEEVNVILQAMQPEARKDRKFFVSYIHRSEHQRTLTAMFLTAENMKTMDTLDPRHRSLVLDRAIDMRLGTLSQLESIFDVMGAKGKAIPPSANSIYKGTEPTRNVADNIIGINPIKTEEPTTMKQPKSRIENLQKALEEILTVRAKAQFPGAPEDTIRKIVSESSKVLGVGTTIEKLLSDNMIKPQNAEGVDYSKLDFASLFSNLTQAGSPSSMDPFTPALGTLYNTPINFHTGSPTPTGASMYAKEQARPAKISRVLTNEEITVEGHGVFKISREIPTNQLSIIFVDTNGNYGTQLVQGCYNDIDTNYIIEMLYAGIEAGHPHKSVLLAVQRLTPPTFNGGYGFGTQPGYSSY
ncbi:hypothetical protein OBP_043 [Pseudomonas phage OBP]|uniref:hypothetical protein n=1 Tax=Pseudomonas phage OBP TaxID=1124849 RepID=UPI000240D628|nr:hypothetical protein OBP_043 [Pseudomonas phage OBP]AEV89480.1 hypothetical protein OBP_043 [Pseudomonas phage OBP]